MRPTRHRDRPLDPAVHHAHEGYIRYSGHLPTERLRRKSENLGPQAVAGIVPIGLVDETQDLAEALAALGETQVDYIVASPVKEHIPDPIGQLASCAEALVEDGLLCPVVPDQRRPATTLSELVAHHLTGAKRPSPLQVFDYHVHIVPFGAAEIAAWVGRRAEREGKFFVLLRKGRADRSGQSARATPLLDPHRHDSLPQPRRWP